MAPRKKAAEAVVELPSTDAEATPVVETSWAGDALDPFGESPADAPVVEPEIPVTSATVVTLAESGDAPPLKRTREHGDRGADIEWVQRKLAGLGYAIGMIDGRYDTHLAKALRQVQQAAGLKVSGLLNSATYEAVKAL